MKTSGGLKAGVPDRSPTMKAPLYRLPGTTRLLRRHLHRFPCRFLACFRRVPAALFFAAFFFAPRFFGAVRRRGLLARLATALFFLLLFSRLSSQPSSRASPSCRQPS